MRNQHFRSRLLALFFLISGFHLLNRLERGLGRFLAFFRRHSGQRVENPSDILERPCDYLIS